MNRRGLIVGLASLIAAPAIVRIQNIMPIKVIEPAGFTEAQLQAIWEKIISKHYGELIINGWTKMADGSIYHLPMPEHNFYGNGLTGVLSVYH